MINLQYQVSDPVCVGPEAAEARQCFHDDHTGQHLSESKFEKDFSKVQASVELRCLTGREGCDSGAPSVLRKPHNLKMI